MMLLSGDSPWSSTELYSETISRTKMNTALSKTGRTNCHLISFWLLVGIRSRVVSVLRAGTEQMFLKLRKGLARSSK
jgi:hypothetical protein